MYLWSGLNFSLQVTVVDDQKLEGSAKTDDESKAIDVDSLPNVQKNIADGTGIMNDVPMEDAEVSSTKYLLPKKMNVNRDLVHLVFFNINLYLFIYLFFAILFWCP